MHRVVRKCGSIQGDTNVMYCIHKVKVLQHRYTIKHNVSFEVLGSHSDFAEDFESSGM